MGVNVKIPLLVLMGKFYFLGPGDLHNPALGEIRADQTELTIHSLYTPGKFEAE